MGSFPSRRARSMLPVEIWALAQHHTDTHSHRKDNEWAGEGLDPVAAAKPGGVGNQVREGMAMRPLSSQVGLPLAGLYLVAFAYCMVPLCGRAAGRA